MLIIAENLHPRDHPLQRGNEFIMLKNNYPFEGVVPQCGTGAVTLILFKINNLKTSLPFPTKYLCNNLYISTLNEPKSCHNPNLQRDRERREDGAKGVFSEKSI